MLVGIIVLFFFLLAFTAAIYAMICAIELYKSITRSDVYLNLLPLLMLFKSTYDSKAHKYYNRFWLAIFVAVLSVLICNYLIQIK